MAAVFATLQVYFRDTASFLPYFVRIWLYLSPVLWFPERRRSSSAAGSWCSTPCTASSAAGPTCCVRGVVPSAEIWIAAMLWAVVAFVVGSLFFISREREFAVRL